MNFGGPKKKHVNPIKKVALDIKNFLLNLKYSLTITQNNK